MHGVHHRTFYTRRVAIDDGGAQALRSISRCFPWAGTVFLATRAHGGDRGRSNPGVMAAGWSTAAIALGVGSVVFRNPCEREFVHGDRRAVFLRLFRCEVVGQPVVRVRAGSGSRGFPALLASAARVSV